MIRSFGPAGAFYGTQTLRQLLPPQIFSQEAVSASVNWTIPCLDRGPAALPLARFDDR